MIVIAPALLLATILLGLFSDGVHHDDDLVHFMMARWSWTHWEYLLHPWGRPGLTIPLAAVAGFGDVDLGWHLARVLSAVVTAAGALLAADVARRQGVRAVWLVVIACYLQPLNAVLSYTTLTENFAAFYLIAGTCLLSRGRPITASLVFSLSLVTRHELVILIPIWLGAIWLGNARMSRRLIASDACVSAIGIYNLLFFALLGDWPARLFCDSTGSTLYTPAGLLNYLPHLFYAVSPALVGLAIVGGISMLRRGRVLVPGVAGAYIATQILLRAFGLFASGGFGRFAVCVAPFIAILCVEGFWVLIGVSRSAGRARRGWFIVAFVFVAAALALAYESAAGRIVLPGGWRAWLITILLLVPVVVCGYTAVQCSSPSAQRTRQAAGVTLVLLCLVQWVAMVRPVRLEGWPLRVREVLTWVDREGLSERPIFAATPWVAYWDRQIEQPRLDKGPRLLASMPIGTVVIWDSVYCPSDFHRLPHELLDENEGYRLCLEFTVESGQKDEGRIAVYEKVGKTPPPAHDKTPYPPNLMVGRGRVSGVYYTRENAGGRCPQNAR